MQHAARSVPHVALSLCPSAAPWTKWPDRPFHNFEASKSVSGQYKIIRSPALETLKFGREIQSHSAREKYARTRIEFSNRGQEMTLFEMNEIWNNLREPSITTFVWEKKAFPPEAAEQFSNTLVIACASWFQDIYDQTILQFSPGFYYCQYFTALLLSVRLSERTVRYMPNRSAPFFVRQKPAICLPRSLSVPRAINKLH